MNSSGYKPFETGVLVKIEMPEDKKTKGGIILTSKTPDVFASQVGVIVDMGDIAFTDYKQKPKIGDSVYFVKYAGQVLEPAQTKDDQVYRIIEDSDVRLLPEIKDE